MIVRQATGLYLDMFQRLPKITRIEEMTNQITVKEEYYQTVIPFPVSLSCLCYLGFFKYYFNSKTFYYSTSFFELRKLIFGHSKFIAFYDYSTASFFHKCFTCFSCSSLLVVLVVKEKNPSYFTPD